MSTIAIVMATYNGERYVGEQIDSILASNYQDLEIYIYDDGSKDSTMSILRDYEARFPQKLHVYQNETNLGHLMNFMHALSTTTTDYVMFSDQDDVWNSNKAAITLKRMKHMEAQLGKETPLAVFTDAVVVDQELKVLKHSFFCSGHLNPYRTDLGHLLMENKLIGCTVMINAALRRILLSRPLPKKARYHDWWLALIAASFGKIGFIREGTLLYRQHGGNVVGDSGFWPYVKNRLSALREQREAIEALYQQAEEFLELYGDTLSDKNREIIRNFAALPEKNFLDRRLTVLHYGFLKTGLLRNIGLLIIL
jgi:glycosyltransferase involved in cell wall biosynthesis